MPKKQSTAKRSNVRNLSSDDSRLGSDSSSMNGSNFNIDYRQIAMDLYNNPTVRYMAGGVAAAILNRFASRLDVKYPEISSFLRENIGTLEGKLNEFRSNRGEEARH